MIPVPDRHPALRIAMLSAGTLMIIATPVAALLPGPGGIFVFAGGLVLILRNSRGAQVHFARAKRRWPRTGHLVDRVMRRPSALRRHALLKSVGSKNGRSKSTDETGPPR